MNSISIAWLRSHWRFVPVFRSLRKNTPILPQFSSFDYSRWIRTHLEGSFNRFRRARNLATVHIYGDDAELVSSVLSESTERHFGVLCSIDLRAVSCICIGSLPHVDLIFVDGALGICRSQPAEDNGRWRRGLRDHITRRWWRCDNEQCFSELRFILVVYNYEKNIENNNS